MRQNIAIALVVVAILLIGVLGGQVNLAIGMFVHEGSVLLVILNGMRLLGFQSKAATIGEPPQKPVEKKMAA